MDDLKKAKLVICTPDSSSKVIEAVEKSKYASNNRTQIVCLGEVPGLSNLFDLMKDVKEEDAAEPIKIDDPDKEKLIIFWSSGTTGKLLRPQ